MEDKPHIMIVEARFYEDIADELARGAVEVLEEAGASYERIAVQGAYDVAGAIKFAIKSREFRTARRRFDGYVALGCVIRGETSHYDYVCTESARALQTLVLDYTIAVGFGILTVENHDQAKVRAAVDQRNKGGEAARACLRMLDIKRQFNLWPRK